MPSPRRFPRKAPKRDGRHGGLPPGRLYPTVVLWGHVASEAFVMTARQVPQSWSDEGPDACLATATETWNWIGLILLCAVTALIILVFGFI
jgi:hypothetical protein